MARLSGWAPPDAFDDFQLVRQLGAGGMGAVYLAHDRALDRLVAVKFIVGDFVDRVARERFAIEARAIARLHHPNVVAVYRIGQVDGHPYLAYEFISGQRLDALRLPLPWPEVLRIAVGLARGLAAVHARGVLHRDVKPANVMLDEQGRVKLLDFGLARMMADGTPAPNDVTELLATPHDSGRITAVTGEIGPRVDDLVLTPANSLVGTPMFIAPELWAGMPATPRSDLYSMGLILYAMLAGALPHVELRGIELAHARRNTDLPSLVELVPAAPRPLTELVDRMVRRHPEDRPVGLDDIRDKLEDLAALYRPAFADHEERDAQRVRASRERVAEVNGRLAARFFELWLAGDPQVAELLPADPGIQRHIVEMSLRLAVEHLGHADQVVPVLEDLGRRHLGRGLDARHLGTMGRALLAALGELDPHWEPETARAWSVAFGRMAMVVQRGLDDAAAGMKGRPAPRGRWEVPLAPPRTRWATHDGADLGYQVVGSGVIDIVVFGDWVTHVERMWQHPAPASFFRHLASLGRVVLFDRRGIGMSDRGRLPTLEQQVDDAVAVLDAVRSDRAVLLALGDGLAAAATLAATRPGRVRALVAIGASLAADDATLAARRRVAADQAAVVRRRWGSALALDVLAPTLRRDPGYRQWWAGMLRNGASRQAAATILQTDAAIDLRPLLPGIKAPTLIIHRSADRHRTVVGARHLAADIRNAQLVELPGADHVPWAGDAEAVLDRIHDFLGGLATEAWSTALTATVVAVSARSPLPADQARTLVGMIARETARHRGAPADPVPGLLALDLFDGPVRAVRCAQAIVSGAARLGVALSCGLDAGELSTGGAPDGPALVRATALAHAGLPGEVRISAAVQALVADAGLTLRPRPSVTVGPQRIATYGAGPGPGGGPPDDGGHGAGGEGVGIGRPALANSAA